MYVAPRPDAMEDPLFGCRLGLSGALAFLLVALLAPAMPTIVAALPAGLMGAQRRAFSPLRVFLGPVVAAIVAVLMAWVVSKLHSMPWVYAAVVWLVYFLGFRMILRSGAPAGMLFVIMGVLFSVIGMTSQAAVVVLRDQFVLGCMGALLIMPLAYLVFPPRTRQPQVDEPQPSTGDTNVGAAIRASVLLALTFWLALVMTPADIMLAVMAAMVLVFPTQRAVFFEATQRFRATLYGGAITVFVLAVFLLSPHMFMLLGLIFLAGLWVGQRMLLATAPHMAYQNAYPAALALIAGALSTQDAGYAIVTRLVLTLVGAFSAAILVALFDQLTAWRSAGSPLAASAQGTA